MQGPSPVLVFLPGIYLEKLGYLTEGAMLQSCVLFSYQSFLQLWLECLELMTTGITGKMCLLGVL